MTRIKVTGDRWMSPETMPIDLLERHVMLQHRRALIWGGVFNTDPAQYLGEDYHKLLRIIDRRRSK